MSNPDEIRRDIERTRAELSENVNALGDSAKPGNIAREQVDKVKDRAQDIKSRIFGAPEDPYDNGAVGDYRGAAEDARVRAGNAVEDAKDAVSNVVGDARDAVAAAPRQVQRKAQGNPLAAGLVALGLGALVGGLLPASRAEKDAARNLQEKAQPLVEEAKSMAMEAKDNLQPLAQEAVESVKQTATEAGEQVKSDAVDAKDAVAGQAKDSAETVKSDAQGAVDDTKGDVQDARNQF